MTREADFFEALFGDCLEEGGRFIELRIVNRDEKKARQEFFSSVEGLLEAAREQEPLWDYYFGVHPRDSRNGTSEAVKCVTCIWADCDWKNFEGGQKEAIERIQNFPLRPTVVVRSGHGYHPYWLLKEPEEIEDLEGFRLIVKGAQKILGSDPVSDLPRILRIPGTLNYKDPKKSLPCKIIFSDYTRRYVISDFEPFAISPEEDAKSHKAAAKIEEVLTPGNRNNALASIAGSMRRPGLTQDEIDVALQAVNKNRCQPPLPESEVRKIAESMGRYAPADPPAEGTLVEAQEPEPKPLPQSLPPVPAFDSILLPDSLKAWVDDMAERIQCPADFPAVGAMITLATVVGRQVAIRPKRQDDWTVVSNLWGAVIGRPGVMKTPALSEVLKPLQRLEIKARRQYEEDISDYKVEIVVMKARKKQSERQIEAAVREGKTDMAKRLARETIEHEGEEPQRRRYLTNDATVEKIGELLAANPHGLLVFRDELTGWLSSLDREGREGTRAFFLEAWNGTGRFTYDRIGRGTIDIEAACLSILGGIQPGPLSQYLRTALTGGTGDDGLLQRFQMAVWPDVSKEWRNVDRWPDSEAKRIAWTAYSRLSELNVSSIGANVDDEGEIAWLRFAPDAQEVFGEWRAELEAELRNNEYHPAFEAHLAKYRSLVPSIALLVHLADAGTGNVSRISAMTAIGWSQYLKAHAKRL
ncbi:DUF3987 domain-containing protein, partial [Acidobacteria bacterium AH-259-O06]|nr:DUF3987 domain-containing protein [Acidobacteria bacterium AH-259-O06]